MRNLLNVKYKGFGPTLAAEMLAEIDGINRSPQTLWRYMAEWGLWERKTRKKKHRTWREPKGYYGEMQQLDGSEHNWFEGRGERCTLLKFIDDATSEITWAEFAPSESRKSVMLATKNYLNKNGIPVSIYVDRGKVFKVNKGNQNNDNITQYERALKNLGIELKHAYSAPAKGRVERSFRSSQDRLVKLLRLQEISTIEEANRFLQEYYLPKHNAKFARQAAKVGNLHRPIAGFDLDNIFVFKEIRTVQNDLTVQYKKELLQIHEKRYTVQPKDLVYICTKLDGSAYMHNRDGRILTFTFIPKRVKVQQTPQIASNTHKIGHNSPWRRTNSLFYK